jgi:hypothetical protein
MRKQQWICGVTLALMTSVVLAPLRARAQDDITDLNEAQPVRAEDAFPMKAGDREFQTIARYDRTRESKDLWEFEPSFQFGFTGGWQGEFAAKYLAGNADLRGNGNLEVTLLKQLNDEAAGMPAFAFAADAEFSPEESDQGVDTRLRFIVSRTLRENFGQPRVHLNFAYLRNDKPDRQQGEQRDGYMVLLGYSRRLGENTGFAFDVYHEQEPGEGETQNIVEAGISQQMSQQTTVYLSLGAGIGADSPKVQARFSFGHQF